MQKESLITKLSYKNTSCLLTGIATRVGEERMGISRYYYMNILMQDSYKQLV